MSNGPIIYLASCSEKGGIYSYSLSSEGKLETVDYLPLSMPMHMILSESTLHILLRDAGEGGTSALTSCTVSDGKFTKGASEPISTMGNVACHLTVYEGSVYCVNYLSGSVIKMPDLCVQHEGCGPHPTRQQSPHTHFAGATPDGKYLCVTDLGTDEVYLYDKNLNVQNKIQISSGQGPRHIAFSDDGKTMFVANELGSSVSVFSYDGTNFDHIQTIGCLPTDFSGTNTASAIRFKNNCVYVGQRGLETISIMPFSNGKLSLDCNIPCHGETIRDFDFAGDFIVCANQSSNNVTVLAPCVDGWVKTDDIKLETPLCVCVQN